MLPILQEEPPFDLDVLLDTAAMTAKELGKLDSSKAAGPEAGEDLTAARVLQGMQVSYRANRVTSVKQP